MEPSHWKANVIDPASHLILSQYEPIVLLMIFSNKLSQTWRGSVRFCIGQIIELFYQLHINHGLRYNE